MIVASTVVGLNTIAQPILLDQFKSRVKYLAGEGYGWPATFIFRLYDGSMEVEDESLRPLRTHVDFLSLAWDIVVVIAIVVLTAILLEIAIRFQQTRNKAVTPPTTQP